MALNFQWVEDCGDSVVITEAVFAGWVSLRKGNVVVSVEAAGLE